MPMEEDLVARLAADATVASLIGRDTDGVASISWGDPVQASPSPWLVLTLVYPGRDYDHNGPTGQDEPRVQIDSMAITNDQCAALARAVRGCLEPGGVVGATRFHEAFLDGESWIDEGEQDGGVPLFRISQDYIFMHEEA